MRHLLLLTAATCLSLAASAQISDFISVRRKNGRTIKSFYTGSSINFVTRSGIPVSGTIAALRNDTVFVSTYNTRVVPTRLGVTMIDTFAWRVEKVPYREIARIAVYSRHRDIYRRLGLLPQIGGAGYMFLNVFNGATQGGSITGRDNIKKLQTAAAVALAGTLMVVLNKNNRFSLRRHRIVYVRLSN